MTAKIEQALLLVNHWKRARTNAQKEPKRQADVERQQEQGLSGVNANREDAPGIREEEKKIIVKSYLRGATADRIARVSKIPLDVVERVIAEGCPTT